METVRDIVAKLKMFCSLEIAIVDKLEEYERRIYALEEDNKRLQALCRANSTRIAELTLAFGHVKENYGK